MRPSSRRPENRSRNDHTESQRSLNNLTRSQRETLGLYVGDLTIAEVSARRGVSENTTKRHLHDTATTLNIPQRDLREWYIEQTHTPASTTRLENVAPGMAEQIRSGDIALTGDTVYDFLSGAADTRRGIHGALGYLTRITPPNQQDVLGSHLWVMRRTGVITDVGDPPRPYLSEHITLIDAQTAAIKEMSLSERTRLSADLLGHHAAMLGAIAANGSAIERVRSSLA